MKKKENIFVRVLAYAHENPLAFLGFWCWGIPIPLGMFPFTWEWPEWFFGFIIILGFVFFGLSQKYEKNS